jgi:hypothetical protein
MSLEGPQLHYARVEDGLSTQIEAADTLKKALELARELEELLEDTRSSVGVVGGSSGPRGPEDARAHSTRMARAFAASLVDELAALVRPVRHTGSS